MAVANLCGWETGDSIEASSTSGTFSVQATTKRTGGYALQTNPATTAVGWHRFAEPETNGTNGDGTPGGSNRWIRVYLYIVTAPSSGAEQVINFLAATGTTVKGEVRLNSDRTLAAYDSVGTLVGTSATALSLNTWYRIEVFCDTSTTAGDMEVKINGSSEIIGSSLNTNSTGHGRVTIGKTSNLNGNTVDLIWDDFAMTTDANAIGAGQIEVMQPNANGSTMQWTGGTGGSDYQEVDEIPTNTADYVQSTGSAGDVALFDFETSASAGISGTINAVKAVTRTRENTAVTSATSVRIRANVTNSDSSGFNGSTSTVTQSSVLALNPDDSAAWETSDLDDIEAGSVEANAVAVRNSTTLVMVDFVPAAPSGGRISQLMTMGIG